MKGLDNTLYFIKSALQAVPEDKKIEVALIASEEIISAATDETRDLSVRERLRTILQSAMENAQATEITTERRQDAASTIQDAFRERINLRSGEKMRRIVDDAVKKKKAERRTALEKTHQTHLSQNALLAKELTEGLGECATAVLTLHLATDNESANREEAINTRPTLQQLIRKVQLQNTAVKLMRVTPTRK